MITAFVGKTPWQKNNEKPLGDGANPFHTIQEAINAGVGGIIIFSQTNFDELSILVQDDFKPHDLSFHKE